jgi:hypothetical protein
MLFLVGYALNTSTRAYSLLMAFIFMGGDQQYRDLLWQRGFLSFLS